MVWRVVVRQVRFKFASCPNVVRRLQECCKTIASLLQDLYDVIALSNSVLSFPFLSFVYVVSPISVSPFVVISSYSNRIPRRFVRSLLPHR